MLYAIRYYLYNFKNVKNTQGGAWQAVVLFLLELQALVTLLHGRFSRFLKYATGIKSCKAPQILKRPPRHLVSYIF